jgi:hypothetical protein
VRSTSGLFRLMTERPVFMLDLGVVPENAAALRNSISGVPLGYGDLRSSLNKDLHTFENISMEKHMNAIKI